MIGPLKVDDDWRYALELAVSETATNIIRYALHENPQCSFTIEYTHTDSGVALCFTDAGQPFPSDRLVIARNSSFFNGELLAESGRGLRLILLSVDVFTVENNAGNNVTIMEKFLPK